MVEANPSPSKKKGQPARSPNAAAQQTSPNGITSPANSSNSVTSPVGS